MVSSIPGVIPTLPAGSKFPTRIATAVAVGTPVDLTPPTARIVRAGLLHAAHHGCNSLNPHCERCGPHEAKSHVSATLCPNWLYFAPVGGTIEIRPMVGNVDIKVRPLKLAYLVDPNKKEQVREAIR